MARLALEHALPAGWVDEVFEAHGTVLRLDDPGPTLMSAEAATFHDQLEGVSVAWFAIPAPDGAGVIARAHTEVSWQLAAAGAPRRQQLDRAAHHGPISLPLTRHQARSSRQVNQA